MTRFKDNNWVTDKVVWVVKLKGISCNWTRQRRETMEVAIHKTHFRLFLFILFLFYLNFGQVQSVIERVKQNLKNLLSKEFIYFIEKRRKERGKYYLSPWPLLNNLLILKIRPLHNNPLMPSKTIWAAHHSPNDDIFPAARTTTTLSKKPQKHYFMSPFGHYYRI